MLEAASLQQLAPYLHKVQLHAAPAGFFQVENGWTRAHFFKFTDPHWAAFGTAAEAFCVAHPEWSSVTAHLAIVSHMNDISGKTKLTPLHLNMRCYIADWQPLRQLKMLEDLALQSYAPCAQCSAVLVSNSHCLRSLTLAGSWDSSTYLALLDFNALQKPILKVNVMGNQDAHIVAGLTTPDAINFMLLHSATI